MKTTQHSNYLQQQLEKRKYKVSHDIDNNIFKPPNHINLFKDKKTFHLDEIIFPKSLIPPEKLQRKQEIKEYLDADTLELKKKKWNNGTTLPIHPFLEETHERRLQNIRMGLADGQDVKFKEQKIYQGTDSRNDYSGWNISVLIDPSNKKIPALEQQVPQNRTLALLPQDYTTPQQAQKGYLQYVRSLKVSEKDLREELRKHYIFENPDSSPEKIDGGVFRLNYESKLKALQVKQMKENPNYAFTPDCSTTLKKKLVIKQYHTGKWGLVNHKQDKQKYAWSCCMNTDIQSEGCNRYAQDLNRWNYVGY